MCVRPSHGTAFMIMFYIPKTVLKLPKFSRAPRASNLTIIMSLFLLPQRFTQKGMYDVSYTLYRGKNKFIFDRAMDLF